MINTLNWYVPAKNLYFEFSKILLILSIEQITVDRVRIMEYSVDRESGDIGFYVKRYDRNFITYTIPRIIDDYKKIDTHLTKHPLDFLIQRFRANWE